MAATPRCGIRDTSCGMRRSVWIKSRLTVPLLALKDRPQPSKPLVFPATPGEYSECQPPSGGFSKSQAGPLGPVHGRASVYISCHAFTHVRTHWEGGALGLKMYDDLPQLVGMFAM
jgi:hypothetical protein